MLSEAYLKLVMRVMIDPLPLPFTPAGATGPEPDWRRGCGPDDPRVIALGLLLFFSDSEGLNLHQCESPSPTQH